MKIDFHLDKYDDGIILTDEQHTVDEYTLAGIPVVGLEIDGARISADYTIALSEDDSLENIDEDYLEKAYCRQKGLPLHILETKRCIIREFCMNDLDALFDLYTSLENDEYVDPLFEYNEEKEYEKNYIKYIYDFYGYGMWLVFLKDDPSRPIGRMGLETRETCNENEAELGYILHPDYRRLGLATEVCSSIIEYGRTQGINTFLCRIDEGNYPSIDFAEKLGFKYNEARELYVL